MVSPLLVTLISAIELFNNQPIFQDPIAAPRSPYSYLTVKTSTYLGERIYYLEAAIGKQIPIATLKLDTATFQFGIDAAAWIDLGYDDGAFPLLLQDFYFGFPLSFKYNNFSVALKFGHISSHVGDGLDGMLEKTLSDKERQEYEQAERIGSSYGYSVSLTEPINYSRDFESLQLAYATKINSVDTKLYAQAGYAHRMFPKYLGRWFVGNGLEFEYAGAYFTPYYAQDVTWNLDVDSVDISSQLGTIINKKTGDLIELRLCLTLYAGSDRRGQLVGRKLRQVGFGMLVK